MQHWGYYTWRSIDKTQQLRWRGTSRLTAKKTSCRGVMRQGNTVLGSSAAGQHSTHSPWSPLRGAMRELCPLSLEGWCLPSSPADLLYTKGNHQKSWHTPCPRQGEVKMCIRPRRGGCRQHRAGFPKAVAAAGQAPLFGMATFKMLSLFSPRWTPEHLKQEEASWSFFSSLLLPGFTKRNKARAISPS